MRSMQTVQELLLADLGIGVTLGTAWVTLGIAGVTRSLGIEVALGTAWVTLGIAGVIVDAVQDVVRNGLTPTQLTHGELSVGDFSWEQPPPGSVHNRSTRTEESPLQKKATTQSTAQASEKGEKAGSGFLWSP